MTAPVKPLSKVLGPTHPSHESPGRKLPTDASSQVITTTELVAKLSELFDRLDEAHEEAVQRAHEFATAEHAFELAFTTARITAEGAEGTAGYKDSLARQSAAEKRHAMTLAQELRRSARDAEDNIRQQMSALQTVAAAVRAEIELAGRGKAG